MNGKKSQNCIDMFRSGVFAKRFFQYSWIFLWDKQFQFSSIVITDK